MTVPNPQPVLPAEIALTDVEALFQSEQPRNWPLNQNSNLGFLRKIITAPLQQVVTWVSELALEMFIATSTGYLSTWERAMGIPVDPTGRTVPQRRAYLLSRRGISPFTRTRRKNIVESYITATFGTPAAFDGTGIPLTAAGVTLYGEYADPTTLYNIVEDVENFSYQVNISAAVLLDFDGLNRDLAWITPAHISFTVATY